MVQFECLSLLAEIPGASSVELAEQMGVTPQTASAVQQSLEKIGLIERTRKSTDGRVMTTQLTERGRSLQRECDAVMRIEDARVLEALEPTERTKLKSLLGTLIRAHTH
jgi:DNA-binding MarR family transcriptional regulator